jgi:hypothetical protein
MRQRIAGTKRGCACKRCPCRGEIEIGQRGKSKDRRGQAQRRRDLVGPLRFAAGGPVVAKRQIELRKPRENERVVR